MPAIWPMWNFPVIFIMELRTRLVNGQLSNSSIVTFHLPNEFGVKPSRQTAGKPKLLTKNFHTLTPSARPLRCFMLHPLTDQKWRWQRRAQVQISLGEGDFNTIFPELAYNGTIDIRTDNRMALWVIDPYP